MKKKIHAENIIALAEAGFTRAKVAKELGVSRQRIDQILQPEKHHARIMLSHHIKIGTIKRPNRCGSCGELAEVEAHHVDYSRPLFVDWLCLKCHAEEERKPRTNISEAIVLFKKINTKFLSNTNNVVEQLLKLGVGESIIFESENERIYAHQASRRIGIKIKTRRRINSTGFEIHRIK
jgi:predicted transcriptional regulator